MIHFSFYDVIFNVFHITIAIVFHINKTPLYHIDRPWIVNLRVLHGLVGVASYYFYRTLPLYRTEKLRFFKWPDLGTAAVLLLRHISGRYGVMASESDYHPVNWSTLPCSA